MEDYIIIGIIIIIISFGIYSTVKHFKGKSGCCGSGNYRPKKKKLSNVIYKKTFKVDGMHCKNCKLRVEEIVNDIKGISGKADLSKNELTVSYSEDVPDELLINRINRAGYTASLLM